MPKPSTTLSQRIANTLDREQRLLARVTPDQPAIVRRRAKLAVPVMPRYEGGTCPSACCTDAVDRECPVHAGYRPA